MRENYEVDRECFIDNSVLYNDYVGWCNMNGKKALNKFSFLKDVHDNIEGSGPSIQKRTTNNVRISCSYLKEINHVEKVVYSEDAILPFG